MGHASKTPTMEDGINRAGGFRSSEIGVSLAGIFHHGKAFFAVSEHVGMVSSSATGFCVSIILVSFLVLGFRVSVTM